MYGIMYEIGWMAMGVAQVLMPLFLIAAALFLMEMCKENALRNKFSKTFGLGELPKHVYARKIGPSGVKEPEYEVKTVGDAKRDQGHCQGSMEIDGWFLVTGSIGELKEVVARLESKGIKLKDNSREYEPGRKLSDTVPYFNANSVGAVGRPLRNIAFLVLVWMAMYGVGYILTVLARSGM